MNGLFERFDKSNAVVDGIKPRNGGSQCPGVVTRFASRKRKRGPSPTVLAALLTDSRRVAGGSERLAWLFQLLDLESVLALFATCKTVCILMRAAHSSAWRPRVAFSMHPVHHPRLASIVASRQRCSHDACTKTLVWCDACRAVVCQRGGAVQHAVHQVIRQLCGKHECSNSLPILQCLGCRRVVCHDCEPFQCHSKGYVFGCKGCYPSETECRDCAAPITNHWCVMRNECPLFSQCSCKLSGRCWRCSIPAICVACCRQWCSDCVVGGHCHRCRSRSHSLSVIK